MAEREASLIVRDLDLRDCFLLLFLFFSIPPVASVEKEEVNIDLCLELLSSDDFEEREEASEWIVKELNAKGISVIQRLKEEAVNSNIREVKFRCVAILKSVTNEKYIMSCFKALKQLSEQKTLVSKEACDSLGVFVSRFFECHKRGYRFQYKGEFSANFPFSLITYIAEDVDTLFLSDMEFGDKQAETLAKAVNLRALYFKNVTFKTTKKGYRSLQNLTALNSLDLALCQNTADVARQIIGARRSFTRLGMTRCQFEKGDLDFLFKMRRLSYLDFSYTNVNDEMLAGLSQPGYIFSLSLIKSKVTDKAAESINKIKGLNNLHVDMTAITAQGIAAIQAKGQIYVSCKKVLLGIYLDSEYQGNGIKIYDVSEGSIAQEMEVKVGDIMVALNDKKIIKEDDIFNLVKTLNKESDIKSIKIIRDGRELKLKRNAIKK